MVNVQITPSLIFKILVRNAWVIFLSLVVCALLGLVTFTLLPKKYKAIGVIDIQSSYFQIPLVGELMSEVYDPGEAKAQRLALLRLALNDAFVDKLGEEFRIYSSSANSSARVVEREILRKRIEYYSLGATSYQVSVVSNHPREAFAITKAVIEQMIETLADMRRKNLLRTRDVIQSHVDSLGLALKTIGSGEGQTSAAQLQQEIRLLDSNIEAASIQFSPKHPQVKKLIKKRDTLRRLLSTAKQREALDGSAGKRLNSQARQPTQDVYFDLLRKLSYLNVVVDMESGSNDSLSYLNIIQEPNVPASPFFPNQRIILSLAIGVGFLLALLLTGYSEFRRGTFHSTKHASAILGAPFLGSLPPLQDAKVMKLLEGNSLKLRNALPAPDDSSGDSNEKVRRQSA